MTQPPHGPSSRPSFDTEIRSALRYEKVLAIKAALVFTLVLAVLMAHIFLFG
jgi:hypothetical protein